MFLNQFNKNNDFNVTEAAEKPFQIHEPLSTFLHVPLLYLFKQKPDQVKGRII